MASLCYLLHFPSLKRRYIEKTVRSRTRTVENAIVQFFYGKLCRKGIVLRSGSNSADSAIASEGVSMIKETISEDSLLRPETGHKYLCLYGHFYQPPREDPFTGKLPHEPGATPFDNFNEKITAECYRPNAEEGNFASLSYDLGPTLASWLEQAHPV